MIEQNITIEQQQSNFLKKRPKRKRKRKPKPKTQKPKTKEVW